MTTQTIEQHADFGLQLMPLTAKIGAQIDGIKLAADLQQDKIRAIHDALLRYKVIFFRNQDQLDEAAQEAFARRLGTLVPHPTVPSYTGTDFVLEFDGSHGGGRASTWHTDITFVENYPETSILRAVKVPPFGGDTVWANTVSAYAELPEPLRVLADRLWALHTNDYDYAGARFRVRLEDLHRHEHVFTKTVYETEHPLVRVHPETGERSLVLGHFVKKLIGLNAADSAHLMAIFQSHITREENSVRWRWAERDVAIWDNRATQHRAIDDYGNAPRIVRRVTIAGESPVSVDGRRSVARSGGAIREKPAA
jgi:alpha-ketoglutarate-dependent sulfate ester dioxygenase